MVSETVDGGDWFHIPAMMFAMGEGGDGKACGAVEPMNFVGYEGEQLFDSAAEKCLQERDINPDLVLAALPWCEGAPFPKNASNVALYINPNGKAVWSNRSSSPSFQQKGWMVYFRKSKGAAQPKKGEMNWGDVRRATRERRDAHVRTPRRGG